MSEQQFDTLEEAEAYAKQIRSKPYGRRAVESIFPGVSVTSDYRGPNHPLSKKNPSSYHAVTDKAVDVKAIPGMTFDQYLDRINAEGYDIIEYKDEYTDPSPWSTGPHWHVVLGDKKEVAPSDGFNTIEEAEAYAAQIRSQKAPQAEKKEPWKPREFKDVPLVIDKSVSVGDNGGDVGRTATTGAEEAQQEDIQQFLFNSAGKAPWEDVEKELKAKYPNQPTKDLKWYYDHYGMGGKTGINWVADKNREAETVGTEDIVVSGDPSRQTEYIPTPFGTLSDEDIAYAQAEMKLAGQQGFPGLAAREIVGLANPDLSREEIAQYQKELREELSAQADNYDPALEAQGLAFGGQMITGAGPEYLLPGGIGSNAAGRLMSAAGVNAVTDAAYQGADIAAGVADEFSPEQNLASIALGTAFEGAVVGLSRLAKETGSTVEADPDGRPYVPVETPEGLIKVYDPSAPITKKAQLLAGASRVVPDARPQEVNLSTSFKDKGNVDAELARTTAKWGSPPEFITYQKFDDLPEDQKFTIMRDTGNRPQDVKAWTDSEGKVHVIADHLDGPEDIPAIAFHEALGHVGLSRQFGARLDRVLADAYRTNPDLQSRVDAWFDEGGQIPDSVDSPTSRATEEVLAEQSELGQIDATLYDKIKNILKDYARRVGIDLKYSDREIRTLLAMAHSKVIGRGGDTAVSQSGNKYIRVYHGSGADFDKFSTEKLYTGEGVNAYAEGLYFTETRDIAEQYRRKLGTPDAVTIPGKVFGRNVLTTDMLLKAIEGIDPKIQREVHRIYSDMKLYRTSLDETLNNRIQDFGDNVFVGEETIVKAGDILRKMGADVLDKDRGRLYEVDLPDDMQWLAWDFQPSDAEKAKLKKLGIEYAGKEEVRTLYDDYYKTQQKMMDIEDAMNALRDENKAFAYPLKDILNPELLDLKAEYDKAGKPFGRKAADKAGKPLFTKIEDITKERQPTPEYAKLLADLRDAETAIMFLQHELDNASPTGETIYRQLTTRLGSKRAASKALEEAGFDGVKYLDGFSRDAGEGSHNYVVFNDEKPTIVNKYMRKKFIRASEARKQRRSAPKEKKTEAAVEKKARNFANSVNLDKLDSTVEISAVLKAVEKDIPKTRVTHDEVRAFAEENGLTFKEVRDWASENGGGRLLAARQLLVRSAERVMAVAKAIDEGDNSPITRRVFAQRMATHRVIQEKISNKISDAARTLNSLKVVADNGGDVEAVRYAMEKSGNDVVNNMFTEEAAAAFAKHLMEHKNNPAATTKVMKDAFSHLPEDYIISFRYNMMLYGLGTHVKNAMGNAGLMYTDIIEHGLASAIGQWRRFTPRERVSARETMSRVMGTFEALAEAGTYREALKSYAEGKPTHSISKIEVGQNLFTKKIGGAGHLVEAPARMLSMSDSFFRSLLEQSSYNGLAHRKALMEGLKGDEYRARVQELKANPTNEMRAMADEHAAIQQLVDDPSSMVKWIEKGKARPANKRNYGHRALRLALHIALPFSRVTDRLFWAAIRRTPIVGMLDHVNRADWAAGGARRDMVLARMVMGAAVIGYLTTKFDDDELSGNGPKNYDKKAQMEAEGWQPNSIKFGDTWYSLAGFDSVAPLASFVVHVKQAMKDKEFDEAGYIGKTLDLIGAAGNAFTDNTFAEQIASLFAMAGGGPMAENAGENYLTNMEKSFIPAGVRQAVEISDGKVRDATGDGTLEGKLEGGLTASTPGYREDLPIRHDVYGREVDSNKNIFSVFQSKKESNDPVILEIKRLTKVNDDKPLVTPSGRKSLEAALKVKKLDASIVQEYQKLAGTYIYESLKEYTSSEDWKTLTDEEKIKQVKKITTAQRKFAREDLFEGLDEKGDSDERD